MLSIQEFINSYLKPASGLSSKGSLKCLHSQVISKECEASCLRVNIKIGTHKV